MAHQLSQESLVGSSRSSATQGTIAAPLDPTADWDGSQLNPDLSLPQLAAVTSALAKDANRQSANGESLKFPNSQPTALPVQGITQSPGRDADSSHSGATSSPQAESQKYNSQPNTSVNGNVRHPLVERMLVQAVMNVPYEREQMTERAAVMPVSAEQQVWLMRNEKQAQNGYPLEGQTTQSPHPTGILFPKGACPQNPAGYYVVAIPPEAQQADEQRRYHTHSQTDGPHAPSMYQMPSYLVPTNQPTRGGNPNQADKPAPKHICKICSRPFLRPSSLQTHYRHHTGEKPFHCPFPGCKRGEKDFGFSVQSNMKRHLNQIHKGWNRNERPSSELSDSDSSQNAMASDSTEAMSLAGSVSPATSQISGEVLQA